jgi:hypothetical protein
MIADIRRTAAEHIASMPTASTYQLGGQPPWPHWPLPWCCWLPASRLANCFCKSNHAIADTSLTLTMTGEGSVSNR